MRISRLLSLIVLLLPLQTFAEVYNVSTTAELRAALASAAAAGGDSTIRLAAGTYSTQDDGAGPLEFISAVDGLLRLEGAGLNQTILDGATRERILHFERFGTGQFSVTIENLSVQNSAPDGTAEPFPGTYDAIYFYDVEGDFTFRNLEFSKNTSKPIFFLGPGNNDVSILIDTVTFSENSRRIEWEATYKSHLVNVTFRQNTSCQLVYHATEADNIVIEQNDFSECSRSPAVAIKSVRNSIFRENTYRGNLLNSEDVNRSKFVNNIAFSSAPHLLRLSHLNQWVIGSANNQFINSGVVRVWTSAPLSNNLFSNTQLLPTDDRGTPNISNNIFINNAETDLVGDRYAINLNNNYIRTDSPELIQIIGAGNLSGNIEFGFADAEEDDYSLTQSSQLIDAGTTNSELAYITEFDFTGTTARVVGTSIDIGPYEYDGETPSDRDGDGDGLNDNIDNCPSIANEDQADNDSDGEGDACDSDDDNDGTNDEDDAFPFDETESLDTDGDGVGNNEDYDDDADGILDSFDNAPLLVNIIVVDTDNDGVIDSVDAYPNDPNKQFSGSSDLDGDGFSNDEEIDYCTNPFDKSSQPELGGLSLPMIHLINDQ